jgi:NAD(P)-dependent dehydrogenase (short-subunit alcohol dehydrogenase family)
VTGEKERLHMGDLDGRTVLVSGVGAGLGRRTALAAAREGANVVLGARSEANLKAVADEVDPSGALVAWKVADIVDPASVEALVELGVERFGGLGAVVHCAANQAMGGLRDAGDFSEWRDTIDTNFIGAMRLTKVALPHLEQAKGSIVFVSSQTQWHPPSEALQVAYAGSKGAIWGAMHHLAMEVGAAKVRVNEVAPGWMWGPAVQGYVKWLSDTNGVSEEETTWTITKDLPLGEMATDADVAEAIVFLASDRARGITGQTLFVNAGEYMH